ncbi:MAG: hypothetical protein ABIJ74_04485, partial [archaeon]
MAVKDFYLSLEDKYYEVIEKINKVIPIQKITDPIDKIIPSFMVLIGIIILILLFSILAITGTGLGEEKDLSFKIVSEEGQAISQSTIELTFNEKTTTLTTNALGKTDKIKVPLNSTVVFEINKTGFETKTDSFKFAEAGEKTITLSAGAATAQGIKRTIKLYDSTNRSELITGKTYTVSFSCSNPEATPPSRITISNGSGEVIEPSDCGELTASVTGNHSESVSVSLSEPTNKIYLDSLVQTSSLTVEVENQNGTALDGIKVNIYAIYESNSNPSFTDSAYTFSGQAEFELDNGQYKITAFDETGTYYEKSRTIYFTGNQSTVISLERAVPEGGYISIKATDKDTKSVLPNTKITLYSGNESLEERTTNSEGKAEFYVKNKTAVYDAVIDNEQYIVKRATGISADGTTITVELEKFTGTNAGTLKVKAVSVEGTKEKPVRNARIALYSVEEDEIFLAGVSEKITDTNGSAEFTKIKNGTYRAFAYKGTSSGWSDETLYDRRNQDEIELIATMIIPDGTVKLRIIDAEKNTVAFATVTFYEEGTLKELKADKTDSNGSIEFKTKADKKVFFKVEKPDFMNYYSVSYPVFGSTEVQETIELIPKKRMDAPEIKIAGVFKGNELVEDTMFSALEAGEEYTVRIQFIVPENRNYESAGIHFRTGNDLFMENDNILIKTINAPNTITTKYTLFDESNLNDSKKSSTQGDAKWFNSSWLVPKAGVYNIDTVIKVKENALLGEEIKLRFRGYGKTGSQTERDPTDVSVSSSNELNAATKEKTFTVGTNVLCSEEFCFSATITDLKEDIIRNVSGSYPTKILQKYELQFNILNNDKSRKHYAARIQLKNENEMLNFLDYRIRNADSLTRSGTADSSETPWIDLGDFDPNTTINATVEFITQETKTGSILIQIVSSQEIVFEKTIQIEVEAPKTFRIEVDPEKIPSNTTNSVEITVFNEENDVEVEDAQIKIIDRFDDLIAGPVLTDHSGKALIEIPGQTADTKLVVRVEKQEFKVLEQELAVDDKIVEITPDKIGIVLNTKTNPSDTIALKIKNLLDFDIELSELKFSGNFRDLLDEKAMNAWMETNYGNIIIPSEITKEIEVKGILTEYAKTRQERDTVDLDFEMEFTNGTAVWTEELPAKITVGIGGEVDDPNCLTLEAKEWKTTTEGIKVKIDFGIENSCTINGEPIELNDLEAKVDWKSNHIGSYTLTFEGNPVELRSAYYKKLTEVMQNRVYTATLAFEVNGGVNGTATADISVRARNPLDGKDEFIEDKIHTEIKAVNLEDCIKFSNTELSIKRGEKASFTVSTSGCGSNVNFSFDSEKELKLSRTAITLGSEETSPEITIDSRDAFTGRYIIKAEAKGTSLATKTQIQNIFVTVYDDTCVQLSRYEFDIYDDIDNPYDGYDTAQIYNYCDEKTVNVTIDLQDLTLSMRKALLPAVIAFGVANAVHKKDDKKNPVSGVPNPETAVPPTGGKVILAHDTPTGYGIIPGLDLLSNIGGLDKILKSVFGTSNPFAVFGITFAAATLYNYFTADDMQFKATADDITVDNIKLLDGIKYSTTKQEVLDTDIGLVLEGPFNCFDSIENNTIDCWDLTFVNENGITQEDEQTPIMKILKTESAEHFWETQYNSDYFNRNDSFFEKLTKGADYDFERGLKELTDKKDYINQYNRLQFNSFNPDDAVSGTQNAFGSCSIGELTGETGENALPKIKLEWRWSGIPENACDETNNSYIYCDATQFSIEVLQKIDELTQRLENSGITCTDNCSTLKLSELIQKTEETTPVSQKERLMELVGFNSFLIVDGYSTDFQKDFHDYAVNTAFFDAPTTYYNEQDQTGIGRYFKDSSLFEFDYAGAPNAPLPEPGLYKVGIDISFNDNSWDLFKDNTPNAKITISMDKLRTAKPNSPLYYLPFDGEIGINSSNGRSGYGLDYENTEGQQIRINDGTHSIKTVPMAVADPTEKLKTVYSTDFKKSNLDDRGKIMQFERTSTGTKLTYTPSIATPVILEIDRPEENPSENAYVFYSISVDGQAQNTGSEGITKWSGIEANCKDFLDRSSQDYMETPDIHGLSNEASYAQITQNKATAYGWVWKSPVRTGKFWLETLIFSPLNSQTRMNLISAGDNARIFTPS